MIQKRLIPKYNIHIGVIIKDEIDFRGISQKELSESSGISTTIINEIIKGKRNLNAEYALKLEKSLRIDAEYLMRLQVNYDIINELKKVSK